MKLKNFIQHVANYLKHPEKLSLRLPPKSDLVVYDDVGSADIGRILLFDLPYAVHFARGERFVVHPLIIGKAIFSFIRHQGTFRQSYDLACLKFMNPRVVVTFIDNSPNLHFLARNLDSTFFVVQNGFRSHHCANVANPLPNLYCFGRRDIDLFAEHHIDVSNFHPVGSIKTSYFLETMAPSLKPQGKYDICLISAYQPGMERSDFHEPREYRRGIIEGTQKTCEFLSRFLKEHPLKTVICGWQRSGENAGELAFFRQYFGEEVTISAFDENYLNSYHGVYQSKVAICYSSTLGYESASWGQKVLFFCMPYENNYRLDNPHSDFFRFKDATYEEFEKRLNQLLTIPQDQYVQEISQDVQYVLSPGSQPAHQILREKIKQALADV